MKHKYKLGVSKHWLRVTGKTGSPRGQRGGNTEPHLPSRGAIACDWTQQALTPGTCALQPVFLLLGVAEITRDGIFFAPFPLTGVGGQSMLLIAPSPIFLSNRKNHWRSKLTIAGCDAVKGLRRLVIAKLQRWTLGNLDRFRVLSQEGAWLFCPSTGFWV